MSSGRIGIRLTGFPSAADIALPIAAGQRHDRWLGIASGAVRSKAPSSGRGWRSSGSTLGPSALPGRHAICLCALRRGGPGAQPLEEVSTPNLPALECDLEPVQLCRPRNGPADGRQVDAAQRQQSLDAQ